MSSPCVPPEHFLFIRWLKCHSYPATVFLIISDLFNLLFIYFSSVKKVLDDYFSSKSSCYEGGAREISFNFCVWLSYISTEQSVMQFMGILTFWHHSLTILWLGIHCLQTILTGKPWEKCRIFTLWQTQNYKRELRGNFVFHLLLYVHSRRHCECQFYKLRGSLCFLPRISLAKIHTGAREKVISLTGRHYVIEETFHCVIEWGSKQQREGSCLKGQFSSLHCHCHTLNSKGRHALWHQRPLIF